MSFQASAPSRSTNVPFVLPTSLRNAYCPLSQLSSACFCDMHLVCELRNNPEVGSWQSSFARAPRPRGIESAWREVKYLQIVPVETSVRERARNG